MPKDRTMPQRRGSSLKYVVPTKEDLIDAVSAIMTENEGATSRVVHQTILKKHNNWKVAERQVRRFVKAKRKKQQMAKKLGGDDDSAASGSIMKRLFRRRSSARAPESAPGKAPKPLLPAYEIEDPSAEEVILPAPVPAAEPVVEKAIEVYEDDNDGKKDGGPCAPCEGCVIL